MWMRVLERFRIGPVCSRKVTFLSSALIVRARGCSSHVSRTDCKTLSQPIKFRAIKNITGRLGWPNTVRISWDVGEDLTEC